MAKELNLIKDSLRHYLPKLKNCPLNSKHMFITL